MHGLFVGAQTVSENVEIGWRGSVAHNVDGLILGKVFVGHIQKVLLLPLAKGDVVLPQLPFYLMEVFEGLLL